jgi:hypothetical protein
MKGREREGQRERETDRKRNRERLDMLDAIHKI